MLRFYELEVTELLWETPSCRLIRFSVPDELRNAFAFLPGQYVTVVDPRTPSVRRCYSICSRPDEKSFCIGVKAVPGGYMSNFLVHELRAGTSLQIGTPAGSFSLEGGLLENNQFVFVAGGSGITPVRSMIDTLLSSSPLARVLLLYGNRSLEDIIFCDHFEQLAASDKRFRVVHSLTAPPAGWTGETGRLSHENIYRLIRENLKTRYDLARYFICGPSAMMETANQALTSLGIPDERIHREYFTVASAAPEPGDSASHSVRLRTDKGERTIVAEANQSLLDAALAAGVELPYSCRMGICSSCKQLCTGGAVEQGLALGLTPEETEAGYVLTCQTYAKDDQVTLDCRTSPSKKAGRAGRRRALVAGLLLATVLLGGMTLPAHTNMLSPGPMNTGHETLACEDCHSPAIGTVWQQLRANAQYALGHRPAAVTFGTEDVDNRKCQSCHERKDDRHPVHRFEEPGYREARAEFGAHRCESCHGEHQGRRLTTANLQFCQSCHADTELTNDPIDYPHAELIREDQWTTCLQCHDFHGNHRSVAPTRMADTISRSALKDYAAGGSDPYGSAKDYDLEDITRAMRAMQSDN